MTRPAAVVPPAANRRPASLRSLWVRRGTGSQQKGSFPSGTSPPAGGTTPHAILLGAVLRHSGTATNRSSQYRPRAERLLAAGPLPTPVTRVQNFRQRPSCRPRPGETPAAAVFGCGPGWQSANGLSQPWTRRRRREEDPGV